MGIAKLILPKICNCSKDYSLTRTKGNDCVWKGASSEKAPLPVSTILPQLKDEYMIGNGASGKVYKIKPDQSSGNVVVKKISNRKDLNLKPQGIPEVEILEKIKHPNIVEMTGYYRFNTYTLILYPYFENGSLADRLLHRNQAPPSPGLNGSVHQVVLDWPTMFKIIYGVSQGLEYMHRKLSPAVLHRNLKSSKILLDDSFSPMIAGFELAKLVEDGQEYAKTTKGDEKNDVFNLGVILLELLTGKEDKKKHRLAKWVHSLGNTPPIHDVLDNAIKEQAGLNDISRVFNIAICCIAKEAYNRPDMKQVLLWLQDVKENATDSLQVQSTTNAQ